MKLVVEKLAKSHFLFWLLWELFLIRRSVYLFLDNISDWPFMFLGHGKKPFAQESICKDCFNFRFAIFNIACRNNFLLFSPRFICFYASRKIAIREYRFAMHYLCVVTLKRRDCHLISWQFKHWRNRTNKFWISDRQSHCFGEQGSPVCHYCFPRYLLLQNKSGFLF